MHFDIEIKQFRRHELHNDVHIADYTDYIESEPSCNVPYTTIVSDSSTTELDTFIETIRRRRLIVVAMRLYSNDPRCRLYTNNEYSYTSSTSSMRIFDFLSVAIERQPNAFDVRRLDISTYKQQSLIQPRGCALVFVVVLMLVGCYTVLWFTTRPCPKFLPSVTIVLPLPKPKSRLGLGLSLSLSLSLGFGFSVSWDLGFDVGLSHKFGIFASYILIVLLNVDLTPIIWTGTTLQSDSSSDPKKHHTNTHARTSWHLYVYSTILSTPRSIETRFRLITDE